MKIKSILSIIVALNLVFPIGCVNNINSYATTIGEDEIVDKWETKTPMPTSRNYLTSAVVDGKIYCIGGSNGTYLNTVEVYDPETDNWETKASMPTSRNHLASAVVNGKIYCIGGSNGSGLLNTVEVYDPATDTWETKASMLTRRYGLTSAVVNGKIYCIGGNNNSYLNTVEVYNPVTDSWETKAKMPTRRSSLTSAVVSGKIYCIGGENGSSLNTVEVYDPKTDSWETKTSMLTSRDTLTSSAVNGKIYCIGGYNRSRLDIVEMYDPATDTWETKTSMPTSRESLTSSVVDGKIYCIGGSNSSRLNIVEVYIPNINEPEYRAEQMVINAEQSKDPVDIEEARDLVNQLPESSKKDVLNDRLNAIFPNIISSAPQTISANADVYIKMANTLSLSLDTNSVTFENFSGVEDMEKQNAINLTVESSLPYEVNASLETEIQNADKSETVDKSILGIKSNGAVDYKTFTAINTPLNLLDNQVAGKINNHGIDLILKKDIIHKADVYKTTIKFEVNQK